MRCAAIVAEYNPFHNGHAYQIEEALRQGASHIAAVMSGNFTQRGEPALFDKFTRARAALCCGVDLVLELPLPYAIAGAQRFAAGAIGILDALGCVDDLVFGSECGDIARLTQAAQALRHRALYEYMDRHKKQGETFAKTRTRAVKELYGPSVAEVLKSPNDILACEYLRALQSLGCGILPKAIGRYGAAHDGPSTRQGFESASVLRERVYENNPAALSPFVPAVALAVYTGAPCLLPGAIELPMLIKLREQEECSLRGLPENSEGLHRRLLKAAREALTLEELYTLTKSKRYTLARIRRLALAAFLDLREEHSAGCPPYIRVLGMNERGRELLAGTTARLPIGGSLKKLERLGGRAAEFARLESRAGDRYALLTSPRGKAGRDYTQRLVNPM